jgi:hypothetical protein
MQNMTFREAAALFDTLDGVTDLEAREARVQVLRTIQPACAQPDVPVSRGKTARFGAARVSQLRLLQVLASLLPPRSIRRLNGFFTMTQETGQPGQQSSMIDSAVAGIAAGEEWTFTVNVLHNVLTGQAALDGGLYRVDEPRNADAEKLVGAGTTLVMTLHLPASDLIRPILDALAEDA